MNLLRALGLAAVLMLASCGGDDGGEPPSGAAAPSTLDFATEQPGPFRVGHRIWTTTYQPPNNLPPRTIRVHAWYPTRDESGEPVRYQGAFLDQEAFEGASLAPPVEARGYPVHVYSHGMWGFAGTSANLMRWFASHGWVAVAPDHAGNTLPERKEEGVPLRMYYLRAADIRATLDSVEALPADDPLAGKARTERVLMSGHSFGTLTTWALLGARFDGAAARARCEQGGKFSEPCAPGDVEVLEAGLGDARVVAGVPMAGGNADWFGGGGLDAAGKPAMLLTGGDDPVGGDKVWDAVTSLEFSWLDFAGGCHQLFGLGGCTNFPEREGFALVDSYVLAFGRRHVLGDASARTGEILSGQSLLSPKITFRHKEPPR